MRRIIQDYIDTDGFDPEWPLYYADHLLGRLNELLGAKLTKSELRVPAGEAQS